MKELICITCPRGCHLKVYEEENYRVEGNHCPRGEEYGRNELQHPVRVLTSTVRLTGCAARRCPVRTAAPIPKDMMLTAARALDGVTAAAPVRRGDVLVKDLCGTGVSLIATKDSEAAGAGGNG